MDIMNSQTASNEGKIVHYETNHEGVIGYRYIIITPLQLGRKTVGYLYQDSRSFSFDMDSNYIKLLTALAPQIALAIDRTQTLQENARLSKKLNQANNPYPEEEINTQPFRDIIGRHPSMLRLYQIINKVAPTQLTVTIYGETGVGKELVASAIHRESARNKGPFIRVNCAALPESLIDSELFGHDKGAFTGAIQTKAGRFELAHKGTIFLDEISELPLQTQSKLLRVIQEREFQRVGGTQTLYSDFRLIAATNRNLKEEMGIGNFRPDLFYRLNVAPITVTPVRERKSDIPLLVVHFAKSYCHKYNRNYEGITEGEMKKFINYPWPGNVRELSNMVEQSVMLHGSKILFQEAQDIESIAEKKGIKYTRLDDVEREHIIDILNITNGKIGGKDGASSLLGLNRCTLIHRMKKLNITADKARRNL
jgi:formate hydrogenlyase transcriptional activator